MAYPQRLRIPRPLVFPKRQGTQGDELSILLQPESQLVERGCPVTFSVIVAGYPPEQADELTYKWQYNKRPKAKPTSHPASKDWSQVEFYDAGFKWHASSPNAASFEIPPVSKDDVAFYRVSVTAPGGKPVVSKPAQLWVWEQANSIIVYGTVYTQTGGGSGCPGAYKKRVDLPSGYWPDAGVPRKARDDQRSDTYIRWSDYYNVGSGCSLVGAGNEIVVAVVDPTLPHYFSVYIPVLSATTPYSVTLTNFS